MIAKIKLGARSALLSATVIATAVGAANAQETVGALDFQLKGSVEGMTAYEVSGSDGIWLMSPDGKTFVNGMVYDLSGDAPVINFKQVSEDHLPEFLRRPQPQSQPEPTAQKPATLEGNIIAEVMNGAGSALVNVEDAKKHELVADLVARMDRAQSPEEFKLLILEWQAEIEGNAAAAAAARKALKDLSTEAPAEPPRPAQRNSSATGGSAAAQVTPTAEPAPSPITANAREEVPAAAEVPSSPQTDGEMLLQTMREDGFWFAIGESSAPVAYVFIDPMCPYCARAIHNLKPKLDDGSLQLRVLLAPVLSRASYGKIASILTSQDPVGTFLEHELEYAQRGASGLPRANEDDIPAELAEGVRTNYGMIFDNGLPGVPFFAYETSDGPKFLSGVPQPDHFSDALPDAYSGTAPRK